MLTPLGPLLGRLYNKRSFERSFRPIFGAGTQPSQEEIDAYWSLIAYGGGTRIAHRLLQYIPERRANRDRWVGAMKGTSTPLRLIDGAADPVSGRPMAERYREVIPDPDVVVLNEIGHYPQMEAPEAVVREYLAFAEGHGL
jgi:pimeloyl-ACP methyl ester carboxylesterase